MVAKPLEVRIEEFVLFLQNNMRRTVKRKLFTSGFMTI